jgi:hypothetical protein
MFLGPRGLPLRVDETLPLPFLLSPYLYTLSPFSGIYVLLCRPPFKFGWSAQQRHKTVVPDPGLVIGSVIPMWGYLDW